MPFFRSKGLTYYRAGLRNCAGLLKDQLTVWDRVFTLRLYKDFCSQNQDAS